jgi:hypothetical protein
VRTALELAPWAALILFALIPLGALIHHRNRPHD